ncbi:hypothetical protein EGW08_009211 [Elysia chlorotica]|uniref:Uncharacterized protein n=1 Tax=Elysia chlorotica TaxID=188477 RepID=A0A3S1BFX1_ELYCH|nr:hypothetical protein EGW08_009211 [Elysia chlorotica]
MLYQALAIFNFVVMIVSFAINGLNGAGDGVIFKNTTGELSDYYYTAITPAGWTFSIWGFIYTWQALWVIYSLVNICRKGPGGKPAFSNPEFIPPVLLALAATTSCLGVAWLISFDRLELEVAFVALLLYSLGMYASLFFSYRALDRASPYLVQQGRTTEIWLTRGLVHNGLAIQGTWVSVATLLNLAMVLTYSGNEIASADDAGTVSLCVLALEIAVFAATDLLFLDRWSRYTLTPYAVLIVALSGSLAKNYTAGARNSVFTIVLLTAACVLAVVKVCMTVYRHLRCPRFRTSVEQGEEIRFNKAGQLA